MSSCLNHPRYLSQKLASSLKALVVFLGSLAEKYPRCLDTPKNKCWPTHPNQALDTKWHTLFDPKYVQSRTDPGRNALWNESLHSSWLMPLHLSITSAPQSEARMPPCLPSKVSQSPRNLKFTGPKTLSALPLFRPRPPRPPKPKLPRLPRLPKLPRPKFIDDEKGTPWAWHSTVSWCFWFVFAAKITNHLLGVTISPEFQVMFAPKKKWKSHLGIPEQLILVRTGSTSGGRNRPNLALLRCFDTGVPAPSATNQMFRHVLSPVPLSIKSMGVDGKCVKPNFKSKIGSDVTHPNHQFLYGPRPIEFLPFLMHRSSRVKY